LIAPGIPGINDCVVAVVQFLEFTRLRSADDKGALAALFFERRNSLADIAEAVTFVAVWILSNKLVFPEGAAPPVQLLQTVFGETGSAGVNCRSNLMTPSSCIC